MSIYYYINKKRVSYESFKAVLGAIFPKIEDYEKALSDLMKAKDKTITYKEIEFKVVFYGT